MYALGDISAYLHHIHNSGTVEPTVGNDVAHCIRPVFLILIRPFIVPQLLRKTAQDSIALG